jgi:hypothetical protein
MSNHLSLLGLERHETFDIFSGAPKDNPMWLETISGLSNARERMEQIAAKRPGQYFIFSIGTHSPVVQIETFAKPQASLAQRSLVKETEFAAD